MSGKRLSKQDRKRVRQQRRERQNKRSTKAGEYSTGKTEDRDNAWSKKDYSDSWEDWSTYSDLEN